MGDGVLRVEQSEFHVPSQVHVFIGWSCVRVGTQEFQRQCRISVAILTTCEGEVRLLQHPLDAFVQSQFP